MTLSHRPKLRIGLLLDSEHVPAWVSRMVEHIEDSGHSHVCLMVINASPNSDATSPGLWSRFSCAPRQTVQHIVHRLIEHAIDRTVQAPPQLPDAFRATRITDLLPHTAQLKVVPQRTQWSDRFELADVESIRAHDLDVLVRIGFRILRGDILRAARHGVWSFHHGDHDVNRGGPPGYWESMEDWACTGCTLQILSEELDNGLVLSKTWSATIYGSVTDNNRSTYWKSLSMLPRQLALLHGQGAKQFFEAVNARQNDLIWYSKRLHRKPTTSELWRLLRRRLGRRLRDSVSARLGWFDQWIMLVHVSEDPATSPWRYKRLMPPQDRFWADPFLHAHEGRTYLYFEELPFATQRGHIAVAELQSDGSMLPPQPALVTDHHLSYPFVFEYSGHVYMIPESRDGRCVPLYRCVEMPAKWEKVGNLMSDVDAVDATLHEHEGHWYMFVNLVENCGGSSCDELFIFHADNPLSNDWQPHPMNPVVSDVRRARPAGRLFMHKGQLYRPSQDCSGRYGRALNFNRVLTLSPTIYHEETATQLTPDWATDVRATHTFNRAGRFQVLDAQIRRRRR